MQGIIRLSKQRRFRIALLSLVALTALLLLFGQLTAMAAISQPNSSAGESAAPQQELGCVEGYKVDDLHVGLAGWVIHARLLNNPDAPVYTDETDATGYFNFADLPIGEYLFWEEMQTGWAPVTPAEQTAEVLAGDICTEIRFKNKQATPTPTPSTEGTRIDGIVYEHDLRRRRANGEYRTRNMGKRHAR